MNWKQINMHTTDMSQCTCCWRRLFRKRWKTVGKKGPQQRTDRHNVLKIQRRVPYKKQNWNILQGSEHCVSLCSLEHLPRPLTEKKEEFYWGNVNFHIVIQVDGFTKYFKIKPSVLLLKITQPMLEHETLADKVYIRTYFRVTLCISDLGQ
jgi:hypothetical protein